MRFRATVELGGKTATGIEVPEDVPADLAEALARDDAARATFEGLSFTHRKEWVRWVEEAKKAETRSTRLAKTVESLRAGQRALTRQVRGTVLGVRPAADDGGVGDEADPAAGCPALGGFPQALVDQRGHRRGLLEGAVHEQFVVQAQHDLGAMMPAPRPDDDRPHLEQLRRGPLDHRGARVPAVGRGGAAASWFRGGEHDQAATIGAQVTPGPPGTVGVIE